MSTIRYPVKVWKMEIQKVGNPKKLELMETIVTDQAYANARKFYQPTIHIFYQFEDNHEVIIKG